MTATPNPQPAHQRGPNTDVRVLFTVEEAARALGIGRTRMFALIQGGDVETVLIGRLRRIPVDSLHTFVNRLRESAEGSDRVAGTVPNGRRADVLTNQSCTPNGHRDLVGDGVRVLLT